MRKKKEGARARERARGKTEGARAAGGDEAAGRRRETSSLFALPDRERASARVWMPDSGGASGDGDRGSCWSLNEKRTDPERVLRERLAQRARELLLGAARVRELARRDARVEVLARALLQEEVAEAVGRAVLLLAIGIGRGARDREAAGAARGRRAKGGGGGGGEGGAGRGRECGRAARGRGRAAAPAQWPGRREVVQHLSSLLSVPWAWRMD